MDDTGDPTTLLDPHVLANLRTIGDPAFCAELVDDYETSTAATLDVLNRVLDDGDGSAVERAAHSLKSSSASMGAATLADLCREVETAGRDGSFDTARERAADIAAMRVDVIAALRAEFPA